MTVDPASLRETRRIEGDAVDKWFPRVHWKYGKVAAENDSGKVGGWQVMSDYQNYLLMRRMRSQRQVLETMTEFWENHFNVPVSAVRLVLPGIVPPFLAAYPDIRLDVIAEESFVDMLAAGCDAGIRYE